MTPPGQISDEIDLFYGAVSEAVCRVYARSYGANLDDGMKISGTLTGPNCRYAETLSATAQFIDRGPGGPPLAEAILPEPCFWTPAMPQLYEAHLQLRHGNEVLAEVIRPVGIRRLGASGSRLRFDGKNWVLRGVVAKEVPFEDLPRWHATDTTLVVSDPSDELCEQASRLGVLLLAELAVEDPARIRQLSRWPAVGIVSLPAGAELQLGGVGHNLLLAERFSGDEQKNFSSWADLAICDVPRTNVASPSQAKMPFLVRRRVRHWDNVDSARSECDKLQANLASQGQFAGYIV